MRRVCLSVTLVLLGAYAGLRGEGPLVCRDFLCAPDENQENWKDILNEQALEIFRLEKELEQSRLAMKRMEADRLVTEAEARATEMENAVTEAREEADLAVREIAGKRNEILETTFPRIVLYNYFYPGLGQFRWGRKGRGLAWLVSFSALLVAEACLLSEERRLLREFADTPQLNMLGYREKGEALESARHATDSVFALILATYLGGLFDALSGEKEYLLRGAVASDSASLGVTFSF